MIKNLTILLFLFSAPCIQLASGQKTSFLIGPETIYLDANHQDYKDVDPGDTLLFAAGNRPYLLIKNFQGQAGKPIVMMNAGGAVVIDTDHYFGISIQNCRYFRFTGTGDETHTYGFQIKRVANGGGMGIGELSSDFEIDHISVENCFIGGIYAKTDPDCSLASVRGTFTQYNTSIHDNYIAHVGDEGLYVGSSKYFGQEVQCDGNAVSLLPSLLEGVKIYNNLIEYSGWDGIQVSSASTDCLIYNNTIRFDSQLETESQMSGILIGGGSKCDCFNNFISQGKGNGIESHGLGGYRIFNNIILDAGRSFIPTDLSQMKHGIFVTDISVQPNASFYIQHNDIINPKSEGIRFSSILSKANLISANAIINPGNFDFYENDNTNFEGKDSYIMFQNTASEVSLQNNYLARNASAAGFLSPNMQIATDFSLVSGSPLIDATEEDPYIPFDFKNSPRPLGLKADIGAFEYDTSNGENPSSIPESQHQLVENPVRDLLKINFRIELISEPVLNIYTINGIRIIQLKQQKSTSGNYTMEANVSQIAAGIYFYTLSSKEYSGSGKFIKW